MDFLDTIRKPWREPIAYLDLVFWVVIFAIVAFIIYDMLRILIEWSAQTASSVAS